MHEQDCVSWIQHRAYFIGDRRFGIKDEQLSEVISAANSAQMGIIRILPNIQIKTSHTT